MDLFLYPVAQVLVEELKVSAVHGEPAIPELDPVGE
jgi:hypothetical protein